jgi:hypothetical protein
MNSFRVEVSYGAFAAEQKKKDEAYNPLNE